MGSYRASKTYCLRDEHCSNRTVCNSNRECTKPWLMGPCKNNTCSGFLKCNGGRYTPFKTSQKCFMWDFECPMDHWCDVFNMMCVQKPDLFEYCEKDIGCKRPYVCSPYSGTCVPPCATTEDCVSAYGDKAKHKMVCHAPNNQNLELYGYCEDASLDLSDSEYSSILGRFSDIFRTVISKIKEEEEEIFRDTDEDVIIDESIGSDGSVHPIKIASGDNILPSGFNLFLVCFVLGLLFYLYYYFIRSRKSLYAFYGRSHRPSRLHGGAYGEPSAVVSKLSSVASAEPLLDPAKRTSHKPHGGRGFGQQPRDSPPPAYSEKPK